MSNEDGSNGDILIPANAPANEHLPSQIIEPRDDAANAQGRGKADPDAPKEQPKPGIRDAIKQAIKDQAQKVPADDKGDKSGKIDDAAKNAKADNPPVDGKKPQDEKLGPDGKPIAPASDDDDNSGANDADKPGDRAQDGRDADGKPQSGGRDYDEAPARLLPAAKEKWNNVPNVVKQDLHRMFRESEQEAERVRPIVEKYAKIQHFDQLAERSGTTLHRALERFVGMEDTFRADKAEGFKALLTNLQITPVQAISSLLKAYNVSPITLAAHIAQNEHMYTGLNDGGQQQQPAPQPQRQQQENPEVAALRQELQTERLERQASELAKTVIEPFAKAHPDYFKLEGDIAKIITSGILEQMYGSGLTHEQKLQEAYRMAGGSTASAPLPQDDNASDPNKPTPRPVDPDGQKSQRTAPSGGANHTPKPRFKSNRDVLEALIPKN